MNRMLWGNVVAVLILMILSGICGSISSAQDAKPKDSFAQAEKAVRGNRLDQLAEIAEMSPSVLSQRSSTGFTLSHLAAGINSVTILAYLSHNAPSSLTTQASDGSTPAYIAAQEGSVECLESLATSHPTSTAVSRKDGMTPAHIAAENGNAECLMILAKAATNTLTARDTRGATPAHLACASRKVSCLLVLKTHLDEHAFQIRDNEGRTVLDIARNFQRTACEEVLLNRRKTDADLDVPTSNDWVKVSTTPAAVRIFHRWARAELPEREIPSQSPSLWRSDVNTKGYWDMSPARDPARLMFFTSAKHPIKTLSEVNPMGKEEQFAFWDGDLSDFAFYFLSKADLVPPKDRTNYKIEVRGSGYFGGLFTEDSKLKLFMTYSINEDAIRKAGGIPVYFVSEKR